MKANHHITHGKETPSNRAAREKEKGESGKTNLMPRPLQTAEELEAAGQIRLIP